MYRFIPAFLVIALSWILSRPLGALPAIGTMIDPVNGMMAAAEPVDKDFNANLKLNGVQAPVEVWFEDRLVPHIRAQNDHDLYFTQGFVHAYFRLWQMDMQTRAAGGRVSEVAGEKALEFDRGQRRKGMVFGAEKSLAAMEADPRTRDMLNAYRDGINTYIATLNFRELPIEYKLMGFQPEPWTNLRSALLLKYMADDLTGKTDDIAFTLLRDQLGEEQFDYLFPERIQGSKPVIPEGTKFDPPSLKTPPAPGGEVWAHFENAPAKAMAPSRPPLRGEEVLGKRLAYAVPQVAEMFPICHLPPPGAGRDGGSVPKYMRAVNFNTTASEVRGAEKQIGDGKSNIRKGVANVRVGKANVGNGVANIEDAGKYIGDGAANVRVGNANVGDASVGFENGNADIARGTANIGDGAATVANGGANDGRTTGLEPFFNGSDAPADPDVAVGSNNWAISGQHTASGKPILCNDPHLGLNLPSLWFEMQLTAPGINSYGVSLPGAPGIVIGYNDKISWGFTNNYRDVKDFYEIHRNVNQQSYTFNGKEIPFDRHVETIGIKGKSDYVDTVRYTIHGPVMYDPSFPDPAKTGAVLACTWMAHRGTNELLSLYLVNRAGDYESFTQAIQHFECPAQNFVYADISGNIAMWGQGRFINKWRGQGKFVMNGAENSTLWGDTIPMAENPHVLNPPQGYLASANQQVTDSTYPYWYNGNFTEWRSWEINDLIASENRDEDRTYNVERAEAMQNWTASKLWSDILELTADRGITVPQPFKPHRYPPFLIADRPHATLFQIWWSRFYAGVWTDEFPRMGTRFPSPERTVELLAADFSSVYFDDRRTPTREGARDIIQNAMKETMDSLGKLKSTGSAAWYQVKNTSLTHLAKLPAFSYDHLKIGGWGNTINAVSGNHGPSWRMIVEMDSIPKAYAIYPGGQSGNPGSKHYGDNVQQWVDGKYNELKFLRGGVKKNPFKYTWSISG